MEESGTHLLNLCPFIVYALTKKLQEKKYKWKILLLVKWQLKHTNANNYQYVANSLIVSPKNQQS